MPNEVVTFGEAMIRLNPPNFRRLEQARSLELSVGGAELNTAVGLAELGKPQGYLERQVRGWIERYHGSKTDEFACVDQISQWMQQHLPTSSDATLIHNDYKLDNLVFGPGGTLENYRRPGLGNVHDRRSPQRSGNFPGVLGGRGRPGGTAETSLGADQLSRKPDTRRTCEPLRANHRARCVEYGLLPCFRPV